MGMDNTNANDLMQTETGSNNSIYSWLPYTIRFCLVYLPSH